jgi:proton-translocating NADH-quinone oxidoreductase chain L
MYLVLVFLPFMGSILAGGLGRLLGYRGSALVSTFCMFGCCLFSWVAFYEVGLCACPVYIPLSPWIDCEFLDASWGFQFDSLTVVMLIVVSSISSLVHMYSISYMEADPHLPRFMAYLSIFTFFMLILVTADNLLQMFFGWEGIGLASYLLINFWVTRLAANKAAIKAMLINKIGDFGLALGIMMIFVAFKTLNYGVICACSPFFADSIILFCNTELDCLSAIGIFLFVGVLGKSAQIGLHTWLPCAMEGPTPVSALIHAATLVTAGVFLMARTSPLLEFAPNALVVIAFFGGMTCFLAASTGIVQNDLKRVIAYSTCSQLGYMVFACGMSAYSVSVFHLMNHAFFKALLFLSAGSMIHALGDEQDLRKMGGLAQVLPYTYGMIVIGSLALTGFPFLTGFYSKDVILELAYAKYSLSGNFIYIMGALSVFFTSYYSFRLLFLGFYGDTNINRSSAPGIHDAPFVLGFPLAPLAGGSIFIGFTLKDAMIGMGTPFWAESLLTLPTHSLMVESEYIPQSIKYLPLILTLLGGVVAYLVNILMSPTTYEFKITPVGRYFYIFFNKRWLFDKVYNDIIGKAFLYFGYHYSFKLLDKGVVEILGPFGISRSVIRVAQEFQRLQTGYVYHYAVVMLMGLVLIIGALGFWNSLSYWIDTRLYIIYLIQFLFFLVIK